MHGFRLLLPDMIIMLLMLYHLYDRRLATQLYVKKHPEGFSGHPHHLDAARQGMSSLNFHVVSAPGRTICGATKVGTLVRSKLLTPDLLLSFLCQLKQTLPMCASLHCCSRSRVVNAFWVVRELRFQPTSGEDYLSP